MPRGRCRPALGCRPRRRPPRRRGALVPFFLADGDGGERELGIPLNLSNKDLSLSLSGERDVGGMLPDLVCVIVYV